MKVQFNDTFKLGDPQETMLWLVDIVGYSKVDNLIAQEELIKNVFNCVYASVNQLAKIVRLDKKLSKELSSDDATVIWTGDGAIIAAKFPFGIDTPLLLTSFFIEFWENEPWTHYFNSIGKNEIPKVHIAAHYGQCRWLETPTLRSPLFEISNCFGVDINLLARIATFSTENGEFIISEEYYKKLTGGNNNFYKLKFPKGKVQDLSFLESKEESVRGKGDVKFHYREFQFVGNE